MITTNVLVKKSYQIKGKSNSAQDKMEAIVSMQAFSSLWGFMEFCGP